MRLTERNILAILPTFLDRVLRTDDSAQRVLNSELLYDCQLSCLHLGIDFEKHAFLGLFLMIYYGVSFRGLVRGVHCSRLAWLLSHREPIINSDRLPDFLQYVVNVKQQDEFALCIAFLKELLWRQLNAVMK